MNDAVVTLVNMIVSLNDQLRQAMGEIERLKQEPQPLREVPRPEEKEHGPTQ